MESPKSNHINFQPLSADFYLSGPILIFDGILEILEDSTKFTLSFFDIDNVIPEEIPARYKDISSEEHINKKGLVKKEENGSEIKTICFNRFKEKNLKIYVTIILNLYLKI